MAGFVAQHRQGPWRLPSQGPPGGVDLAITLKDQSFLVSPGRHRGNGTGRSRRSLGYGPARSSLVALLMLVGQAPLLAQDQRPVEVQRRDDPPSVQATRAPLLPAGQRMPIWELMPPPPLPALEAPQAVVITAAAADRSRSVDDVALHRSDAIQPSPRSGAASYGPVSGSRPDRGLAIAQQAESGLTPVSGFPSVSSTGYGSGLIWELAPTPLGPSPLAAVDPLSVADPANASLPSQSPSPLGGSDGTELGQVSAAPSSTGLRWDLLDDVSELAAEAPDPEQLTVPVADRYTPPYLLSPYIGGGIPSGYVAGWGDFYMSGSAATPGKLRDGQPDGSFNIGMGIGDADKLVAFEVDWGTGSVKNFNFNGGISLAIGRNIIRNSDMQLSVAAGIIDIYEYGNEEDDEPSSPYGVVSLTVPLRPNNAVFQQNIQFSLGGGGAAFAPIDDNFEGPDSGFFASIGLELSRNAGISAAWSGRGMNANLSLVPFRDIPISINLLAADLFDQTPTGTVGVLSLTWGSNFAKGVF